MSQSRLSHLAIISIENEEEQAIDSDDLIKKIVYFCPFFLFFDLYKLFRKKL